MRALVAALLVALSAWTWSRAPADARTLRVGVRGGRGAPGRPGGSPTLQDVVRRHARSVSGRVGLGPGSRRRRAADRLRVVQAVGALAAELESGQPPRSALAAAAGSPPAWPGAVAAVRLDGDIGDALRGDATVEPLLAQLAACWDVAAESGAGLAASVTRLAASARSAEDIRMQLEAQLAGPRATARLLAGLPVVGIGLGLMLGSDPLSWLLTTTPGLVCLVLGVTLTLLGAWWTGRIARHVERML